MRTYIRLMADYRDTKRRKAIVYILRRRKRGRKTGANSGDNVKSWAEYSEVNFTPTGSAMSGWWRVLIIPLALLAMVSPIIIISGGQHADELQASKPGLFLYGLIYLVLLLCAAASLFFAAHILSFFYRAIRGRLNHKNE
ncbi:MAG: hypothetical protein AAGB16_01275 [Pseudomonadota bacterium]